MQRRWNNFRWTVSSPVARIASDLRRMGYEPTNRDSPFSEQGKLWSKGYEVVCDDTAIVIRAGEETNEIDFLAEDETVYRYRSSNNVKLPGGFISSYEWGDDGEIY